jgi:hypothetical protein
LEIDLENKKIETVLDHQSAQGLVGPLGWRPMNWGNAVTAL